jgi:hypothetical protein
MFTFVSNDPSPTKLTAVITPATIEEVPAPERLNDVETKITREQ